MSYGHNTETRTPGSNLELTSELMLVSHSNDKVCNNAENWRTIIESIVTSQKNIFQFVFPKWSICSNSQPKLPVKKLATFNAQRAGLSKGNLVIIANFGKLCIK